MWLYSMMANTELCNMKCLFFISQLFAHRRGQHLKYISGHTLFSGLPSEGCKNAKNFLGAVFGQGLEKLPRGVKFSK